MYVGTNHSTGRKTNQIKAEIIILDEQIEKLLDGFIAENSASKATVQIINAKIEELAQKKSCLEKQLSSIAAKGHGENKAKRLAEACERWPTLSMQEKKRIANTFIQQIWFKEGELKIEWRYAFLE